MGDKVNYIKRFEEGIEVNEELGSIYLKTSLKKYINKLCYKKLSTYDGRRESTSKLLGENNNVPIYVDEETILYPIKSIRCYDTVFVNFIEVLCVKKVRKGYTSFIFTNLSEITLEVSINKIKKQHLRIKKIIEYLNN